MRDDFVYDEKIRLVREAISVCYKQYHVNHAYKCRPIYVEYLAMISHKNGFVHNFPTEIVRRRRTHERPDHSDHSRWRPTKFAPLTRRCPLFCARAAAAVRGEEHPVATALSCDLLFFFCLTRLPSRGWFGWRQRSHASAYLHAPMDCWSLLALPLPPLRSHTCHSLHPPTVSCTTLHSSSQLASAQKIPLIAFAI
jgi:hypothetical protein